MNMGGDQQAFESANMTEKQKKNLTDTHTEIPSAWSEPGHRHLHRQEKQVINWCENTHQTCVMGIRGGWILLTQYTRSWWGGEDRDRRNGENNVWEKKRAKRRPCLVRIVSLALLSPLPSFEEQLMDLLSPTAVQS